MSQTMIMFRPLICGISGHKILFLFTLATLIPVLWVKCYPEYGEEAALQISWPLFLWYQVVGFSLGPGISHMIKTSPQPCGLVLIL